MQGLPFDDLKLRASAGVSGNQAGIGFASLAVIGFGSFNSNQLLHQLIMVIQIKI